MEKAEITYNEAQEMGIQAYEAGVNNWESPFPAGSDNDDAWAAGWHGAAAYDDAEFRRFENRA